ncbi:sterile alpha motif domain-containing protein 1-like [Rhipicephalus sanguineus]|uniref:sterile alpha motif domain-containing protein 1-like n=1 Tax=Rhipicephalus sanguineus TaxID=34632 RepID=UPI0020C26E88|nr:sterile alpha motif domain-containing protein 1-like [Rhipicephalus sanguineus]
MMGATKATLPALNLTTPVASTSCGSAQGVAEAKEDLSRPSGVKDGDHPAYSRSCPSWKKEKEIIGLKVKFNLSFQEARKRFSLHNQSSPSYADVSRRGAAPHLPAPARVTRSVTAVAPSAPPAGVACAAPSPPKEGQQTPEPAGPKAAASAVRPKAAANVPAVQAPSTTSEEQGFLPPQQQQYGPPW